MQTQQIIDLIKSQYPQAKPLPIKYAGEIYKDDEGVWLRGGDVEVLTYEGSELRLSVAFGEMLEANNLCLEWEGVSSYLIFTRPPYIVEDHREEDYLGLCPECHKMPMILNIGRNHVAACHTHKVKWSVGSNMFSGWRNETEKMWRDNEALLETYQTIEPYHYPEGHKHYRAERDIDNTAYSEIPF